MSTITPYSPLNISETVRDNSLVPKVYGVWGIKWSRVRIRHVIPEGKLVTPICLEHNISKTGGDAI